MIQGAKAGRSALWTFVLAGLLVCSAGLIAFKLYEVRTQLFADRLELLRERVELAFGIVGNYHRMQQQGQIPAAQAREMAREALRPLRFGDNDYLWIVDREGQVVMHPILSQLEGQNLAATSEREGDELKEKIMEVLKGPGQGFFDYEWTLGEGFELHEKTGYLRRFEPWGWAVASGIYIDDLEQLFWAEARDLLVVYLTLLAVVAVFWFGFRHYLLLPVGEALRYRDRGKVVD